MCPEAFERRPRIGVGRNVTAPKPYPPRPGNAVADRASMDRIGILPWAGEMVGGGRATDSHLT